jgi:hypothetical protein
VDDLSRKNFLRLIDCSYVGVDAASSIQDTELTFRNLRVSGQLITHPAQLT